MRTNVPGGVAVIATILVGLAVASATAGEGDRDESTTVTIWRAPANVQTYNPYGYYQPYGGYGYGAAAGDAAFISHRRKVDIAAEGELRFPGVSTKIDPSTVQFRSLTDAKGTSVVEQRYAYDLGSPEKLMRRYVGKQVTVTTGKGEVSGVLRGIDSESLVIESGTGKTRAVEIIRRGDNLLDIKLAAADAELATEPTLIWKVVSKKPGKQQIEVSYRTDGLRWDADYTAILDDDKGSSVELSAWATITNDTGVEYEDSELVLVTGVLESQQPVYPYAGYQQPRTPHHEPATFKVPREVTIAAGGTVQVELMPSRSGSSRRVVLYETTADMSASYQTYMQYDCYSYNQPANMGGKGELALEIDGPGKGAILPEGRVRVFKKKGDGLELLGEDQLKVNAETGQARLRLGTDDNITGSRTQRECKYDERTRTLREKFEVVVENKGKSAAEVVMREYMYRWVNWKIDTEDVAGTKAAAQTQEYRVKLAGNSKKTFTYTVVYSW